MFRDTGSGQSTRHNGQSMTDAAEPPQPALQSSDPTVRQGWPTPVRRIVIALVFLAAVAFLLWATHRGVSGIDGPASDRAVVSQVPGPGDRVLRQTEVGAELLPGYDGRLTVNGVVIPEEQMQDAVDPNSLTAKQFGVRPNNRNRVFFLPGPGKVIDKFSGREVSITVRFWKESEGQARGRAVTWQFSIT